MSLTRFSLAGLAVAMVGAAARDARADDLTITTATTTPVVTSDASNSSAGDITIASGGSITITEGQVAITVDSDNDVTNSGAIRAEDEDDVVGILIQGGFSGQILNSGTISLIEDHNQTDTDNDGNVDGPLAIGNNRHGIWLQAGPAFTGDILQQGVITVEGNNSSGIRLDAQLIGDIIASPSSSIVVVGENNRAIAINGGVGAGVDGDVTIRSSITARGENAIGLLVDAPITGALTLNGTWLVTGYNNVGRPITQALRDALDPEDMLQGGSAVHVRHSIGGGVLVQGIGVEDDEDDDGDGETDDADDNYTAAIRSYGSAPTLHIEADGGAGDLVLGATASGFGVHVRGVVEGNGVFDGVEGTAIRIEGQAGAGVTTAGGVAIDRAVRAAAYEADSYALYVGAFADVPQVLVRGTLEGISTSEDPFTAHALFIGADANAPHLVNSGVISAIVYGEEGTAAAITDLSNTLTTIDNTGVISAMLIPTDDNLTDNIVPEIVGPAIAIDVSASTVGVTINQTPDVPFTDDDSVDDDADTRPDPLIRGEIRLGAGADTINLLAGSILGDISFADGADVFNIDNGAIYRGRIFNGDGQLTLNVQDGVLDLQGGAVNITAATFGADSELRILLSDVVGQSTAIHASGDVTFDVGAVIVPIVPNGLPASGSHTFISAGGTLFGAANVVGVVSGEGTPFVYNLEIALNGVNPNALDAVYTLKTAAQLGMTANQGAALDAIIGALRTNDAASGALSRLYTADGFFDAYDDLMPSYSSAAAELAATAIQQQQSAATNRLATTRLQGLNEVSVWGQEIGYMLNRTPPTANGQAYDGHGFGFALGIDGPLDNGALFGLAVSFVTSEVEEDGRPDGEIAASFGQINAYLGTAVGAIDLDFVGGFGLGKLSARRFVEIGSNYREIAEGEWWAYEGHASVRASLPMKLTESIVFTPRAALTYVALQEDSYEEEGAGAVRFEVGEAFSQRLWGDVGVELSSQFRLRGTGVIAPRLYVGYRANLIDDAAERDFVAINGGTAGFTLTDDPYGDGAPLVGLGIDASNGYSTFSLSYEGEFGDQVERHSLNAAVRFRF